MVHYFQDILEYINTLPVIDSHEHLPGYEKNRPQDVDVISEYFSQYIVNDLRKAGMTKAQMKHVLNTNIPLLERWDILEPYWKRTSNTGYAQVLKIAARDLHGVEKISRDTIEDLNAAFLKTLEPGRDYFGTILKEKCHIECSILDISSLDVDERYFKGTFRADPLILDTSGAFIEEVGRDAGISIRCFEDWLEACETVITDAFLQGAAAMKLFFGERTLRFEKAPKEAAKTYFESALSQEGQTIEYKKAYQDYMMHYIMGIADRLGVVAQFHTGLISSRENEGTIYYEDPALLSNLFQEYSHVTFDLLHAGYPYQQVMSALGKMFSNVYLDLCWTHIISPTASVRILREWLDSVPVNKIIAFGGDYRIIDAVYGHLQIAKRNVSKALAQCVEDGTLDLEEAKWAAKRMFYDNPKELFGI